MRDFDFENKEHQRRVEIWLEHTLHSINTQQKLTPKDLKKTSELLFIIRDKRKYKIPIASGKRKKQDENFIMLCAYLVFKSTQQGATTHAAIKQTAETLCRGEKTIEKYYYAHKKKFEKWVERGEFDGFSKGFERHFDVLKEIKSSPLKR